MAHRQVFTVCVFLALTLMGAGACRRASPTDPPAEPGRAPAPQALTAPAPLAFQLVGDGPGPLVVLLHGYGTSGDDLVSLARSLHRDVRLRHLRFVLPAGRLALPRGGRAWWPLRSRAEREAAVRDGTRDLPGEHPAELPASRAAVLALLADLEARYDVPPEQVAVGGFSQGAMLAVDVALHRAEGVGAVFALSGSVVGESVWRPLLGRLEGVPVMVSHGRQDTVLPFRGSERLRAMLEGAEAEVRFVPFEGDHTISPAVLTALGDFLAAALPAPS